MKVNYLEQGFQIESMFIDETVFDIEYIPEKINHRENELVILSRIFLPLLKNPNSTSKKVIIMGNVGVGKTVTVQYFSNMLKESAKIRNLNIKSIHINCRQNRTGYMVLKSVLKNLKEKIPIRGYSAEELLDYLLEVLKSNKCHLVLILDEINYFLKKEANILYNLTRLNEKRLSNKHYLSIIAIVKDFISLNNLDDATLSTLQNEVIKFNKYNSNQIFDILKDRIEIGLKPGSISDENIRLIASLAVKKGDMRKALKILKNAVIYTEHKSLQKITVEAIRCANYDDSPLSDEDLTNLSLHKLFLLYSITSVLINDNVQKIPFSYIKDEYISICQLKNFKPKSNTQLWNYIKDLESLELINSNLTNKQIRGRVLMIGISKYSVKKLNERIYNLFSEKLSGDL